MTTHTPRGCFISLEGLDGAGKSTHVPWLVDQLKARGLPVLCTREPGGTPLGEQLRQILLETSMHLKTETLLMFAARCEHVNSVILPALEAGQWVVCDRFTDASYAYQGGGRQLGKSAVHVLEQWAIPGIQPDRTWLFDVPLEVARERLARSRQLDRFEQEGEAFFERTRQAYHQRVQQQPHRFHLVDSTLPIEVVRSRLAAEIDALVSRHDRDIEGDTP
ncbi:dTMP kinase [Pusillimonas sp. ANT_WB101]|uniref:dTMP kinase n=1 Tax=Pusillimonas sp. ANT_WB101 TaxID=2597356 RepID=UPI0011ECD77D|nr:dTMP kinase [Pusillimonas sp. ANT_WB101]KAA0911021.1 dTMP kinase [Pusillimonas sp. ANT_WB101]